MLQLPSWCSNPAGRALVEQIIAERPPFRITRGQWIEGGGQRSYAGDTAGSLRRMHKDWTAHEYERLNRHFAITHCWDSEAAREILGAENGNQLIERVLRESAERAELEPKELPNGRYRVAA